MTTKNNLKQIGVALHNHSGDQEPELGVRVLGTVPVGLLLPAVQA